MRNIALFAFILSFAALSAQDTLPNPGFEEWTYSPAGGGSHRPVGWNTYNPLTAALNKFTAFRADSTEAHSGSYAIKLVSKFMTTSDFAPAVVTTGTITPSVGGITKGIPIASRPDAVTGWYKYFPLGNDQALFEIFLFKAGMQIGSGQFTEPDSVSAWTTFTVPIDYTSTETPDTIRINLFASTGDASPPSEEGSTLYIDDVAYDFPSGINAAPITEETFNILPNPASDNITVEIRDMHIESIVIYSLDGRKVKEESIKNNVREIRVDDLMPGKYLLTAQPSQGKAMSKVFEIQR